MNRICVTGLGIVTSIGFNLNENLKSLQNARSGIKKAQFFKSRYTESHNFGEVPLSTADLLSILKIPDSRGITRTDALAIMAFREATSHAGLKPTDLSSSETAFISASTVGGMCEHKDLIHDVSMPAVASQYLNSYQYSSHTLKLINLFGIKGITNTINTACSSSANAIISGIRLIRSKRARRVIVGGVDCLSKYTVNGFNALRILSESPCQPFDMNRQGLSLGEGAAYIVLEEEPTVSGKSIHACLTGYANASDAFHQSSLSDDGKGVIQVMTNALKKAGLSPDQIHYINTHGTGTENNDRVELLGMKHIFSTLPPYNATKSYTGHTLGAAGAVEAIFSILSIMNRELHKSLHCLNPIEGISPVNQYKENVHIEHVLSNSFGFGGNCTSLVLSKP